MGTRSTRPAWLLLLIFAPWSSAQTTEVRGLWITRFEWPSSNPDYAKLTIDAAMDAMKAARFNTVFFQIRGQADTLYPSAYEVWSPLIGGSDPGWDPLAYAITAAHSRGLEFHAYINTHTCWQGPSPPTNPMHTFYRHCNAADPNARDWLIHDFSGNPVQYAEDDYVWFAPGVPAFQSYLRQQVMYVVRNYDVDGIHFDRIRTADYRYSHDPISTARFGSSLANPGGLGFDEWTADQVTRNVRDMYASIAAIKPWVKVSAAVFPSAVTAPRFQHQDATAWLAAGALDTVVPMDYSTGEEGSSWDLNLQDWLGRSAGRHVVMGQHTNPFGGLYAQIQLTRMRGGAGTNLFSWSSFQSLGLQTQYAATAYPTPAVPVPMPWKLEPSTAVVQGFVTDIYGNPAVDAHIQRSGSAYVALASGDGYYSHLLVSPGNHAIAATHPDYGTATVSNVVVAAGQVKRVDLVFITSVPEPAARLTCDQDQAIRNESVQFMPYVALPSGDTINGWTLSFGDGEFVSGSGPPGPIGHIYLAAGTYSASFTMTTASHGSVVASVLELTVAPLPPVPGDFDDDLDVDQEDFGHFQACLSGAYPQTDPTCSKALLDGDDWVNSSDLVLFGRCYTGPGVKGSPTCAE